MSEKALTPLKKYAFKVFLGPTLKLFECVCELLSPFLVRYIIDEGIEKNNLNLTLILCAALFGIAVLGFLVTMLAQYLASRVAADYGHDLRGDLFHHLSLLSERQLNDFGKDKVLTIVNNDSFSLQNGVMMFMRLIFRPPFIVIGSTVMSFLIDWRAGIIFASVLILSSAVIALVMAVAPKRYAAIQENLDEISTLGNESLKGARVMRAFNKQEEEEERFSSSIDSYQKKNMDMAKWNALLNPLTFCFINLGLILIVYLGGFSSDADLSTGEIVSLISYTVSFLAAVIMFSRMIVSVNKALTSKRRVDAFLDIVPQIENKPVYGKKDEAGEDIIKFDDVSLTYGEKGDKPAVYGLSFSIKKGSWVGLIGGTGSGKSSTISLLERLYDPSRGEIYYRGHPIEEYDLDSLRKEIAYVSQRPSLFKGTIRSNLLIGKSDATDEEMERALKQAEAYEFVSRYDDYLDHEVEEGGSNFSGGQKQRLLIARALLKGGDILILDDSLSALDYISDSKVRSHIGEIEGLTKIQVSQRATSLRHCDKILVYDNGTIIAEGNHEYLMQKCPIYKEIVDIQSEGGLAS